MSAAAASSFPPKPIKAEPGTSSTRYTKPGQTLPTPSPGSGDRVFYESLLKENPDSIMALEWCVKHGTAFEGGDSEKLYEHLNKLKERMDSKKGKK